MNSNRLTSFSAASLLALFLYGLSGSVAHASVTTVCYVRTGQTDPGVAAGPATNTTDPTGLRTLTLVGSPSYSTNVSPVVYTNTGSSWCMSFTTSSYGSAALITSLTNNFGVELWVKP